MGSLQSRDVPFSTSDTLIGLWDGVKFIGKQGIVNNPISLIYRLIVNGNPLTVEDQRRWETAKGIAATVADVVQKINQDRQAFIHALQTGNVQELNALSEEYRIAFEFAAEMLDTLWADIAALPKYEQGKIVGRIIGEIVLTVLTGGGAAAAKGATMISVAAKLKQITFLQRFAGKFDDLILFYQKVDDVVNAVDGGVTEGKAIASRIASIILHRQRKHGEGIWKSFEEFLTATATPAQRKMVDPHMMFAANFVMREAYKEGADVIRSGGTLAQAMEKVPTIKRVNQVMAGRRELANIQAHHTATQEWTKRLIPNITQSELDDMPALLLEKAFHRQMNGAEMNRNRVFHNILRDKMRGVDGSNVPEVLDRMEDAYKAFEGLGPTDPAPDVWIVTKAWIDSKL